jgi:DNA-binding FrmR family transcriptional regulator
MHECATLHLDPETREESRRRLLSVKGHVEGVLRMLDDESVYCVDVLKQVKALDGAMKKISTLVMHSHLKNHVVTSAARGDADIIISELMELLKYR